MENESIEGRVWYACYGSNLCAERFLCYIKGGKCRFNGREYPGCRDKTPWTASFVRSYPGGLYFGNSSSSWRGGGVAFYDPDAESLVLMRLYNVTYEQLLDVQEQEGNLPNWYGRLIRLGGEDGLPVYTMTSEKRHKSVLPHDDYYAVIWSALVEECGVDPRQALIYLERAERA